MLNSGIINRYLRFYGYFVLVLVTIANLILLKNLPIKTAKNYQ